MDLENLIRNGAFNEKGGLHKSNVVERHLVDFYVPFLPLERIHVKQCIEFQIQKAVNEALTVSIDIIMHIFRQGQGFFIIALLSSFL